ncbi:MAG: molybdopterin molybdotransferase MoeA [Hyphomicrobiaceae bacterium]|nr:molybdopterin molybdotransferase MoeA [Hyphomicrobiaceae bacterium]
MLVDDCFRPGAERMAHGEAIALLRARLAPIAAVERLPLAEAHHRILAEDLTAARAVPEHTNAAVDGYAVRHDDYVAAGGRAMPIAGRAAAGHPLAGRPSEASAVRILTGATLPEPCDTVVMQEDVTLMEGADGVPAVVLPDGIKRGANVRRAGEDVAAGALLFTAGNRLRAQDLAALASVGIAAVACYRRLRVGLVSTGDEIIRPGAAPRGAGDVFDANAPMLAGLVTAAGGEPVDLGVWPDQPAVIAERLAEAARSVDVIVTSGGASRGEEDHMAAAVAASGQRHFWQINVKPGRPMLMGQIGDTVVVGLPGNPVAVFVCFLMYVHPMLRRLGGGPFSEPVRYSLPAAFEVKGRKVGRREFWRASLVTAADGGLAVEKFARDGSGLISGLRAADGLIDIPEGHGDVAYGDRVAFMPFAEFGL